MILHDDGLSCLCAPVYCSDKMLRMPAVCLVPFRTVARSMYSPIAACSLFLPWLQLTGNIYCRPIGTRTRNDKQRNDK